MSHKRFLQILAILVFLLTFTLVLVKDYTGASLIGACFMVVLYNLKGE